MKILQLTLTDGRKIYVNFNLVTGFFNEEKHTMLCFGTAYNFNVKESVEYIYDTLNELFVNIK